MCSNYLSFHCYDIVINFDGSIVIRINLKILPLDISKLTMTLYLVEIVLAIKTRMVYVSSSTKRLMTLWHACSFQMSP